MLNVLHCLSSGHEVATGETCMLQSHARWLVRAGIARPEGYMPCMQALSRTLMLQIASMLECTCEMLAL